MKHKLYVVGGVLVGILAVLVIERKTGIFTKLFSKIPGVSSLVS